MQQNRIKQFQKRLLTWFDEEFRDLPWRQTENPYAIWVSEIMLQQTQVKTVVPYYERFMAVFPSIADLAQANLEEVLKLWEGLGYYARARNLHKAAQKIVQEFGGTFPNQLEQVNELPGIGPYTAAAIMSIAFGADLPVIDGNVNRVLSRLFRVPVDPKSTAGKKIIQEKADVLFAHGRAGSYNQAIMELGALICTPRSPKCLLCPVSFFCQARLAGTESEFPIKTQKKPRPHRHIAVGIVRQNGNILIDKRKEDDMLGGLWEFPGGKVEPGETYEEAVVRELKEELGIDVRVDRFFATIEHGYSHFTISMHAYECQHVGGEPQAIECSDWRWVPVHELRNYAFPRANGKLLDILLCGNEK